MGNQVIMVPKNDFNEEKWKFDLQYLNKSGTQPIILKSELPIQLNQNNTLQNNSIENSVRVLSSKTSSFGPVGSFFGGIFNSIWHFFNVIFASVGLVVCVALFIIVGVKAFAMAA